METSNNLLLYDDNCPLCVWYTGLFVKYRLLSPGNRQPFSAASENVLARIDLRKGMNEIPWINPVNGSVLYGLDALLAILGKQFPVIETLGKTKPAYWFFSKLYKFVSLNRKVVVAKKCGPGLIDCSPEYTIRYRIALVIASIFFILLFVSPFYSSIISKVPFFSVSRIQYVFGSLSFMIVNYAIGMVLTGRKTIEYFGQLSMLLLITLLLFLPLLLITIFFTIDDWMIAWYSGIITCKIVKEYFRRMRYVDQLPKMKVIMCFHFVSLLGLLYYLSIIL